MSLSLEAGGLVPEACTMQSLVSARSICSSLLVKEVASVVWLLKVVLVSVFFLLMLKEILT